LSHHVDSGGTLSFPYCEVLEPISFQVHRSIESDETKERAISMYRWSHLLLLPGLLALAGCGDGDNDGGGGGVSINTLYSSDAVKGEKGLLRIALGNAAGERTKVALSSSAPDVIDLPSSVTFPAGSRSLDIEFDGKRRARPPSGPPSVRARS
jgi:hypothetical protein